MSQTSEALRARVEILDALCAAPGAWVSGGELSERLRRSRTAISNHVAELRGIGYAIESTSARGYRLGDIPDTVHPVELYRRLGPNERREIHYFDETDSTSTQAARMAEAGAPHGTVVVAERQSAGRGRLGRSWSSPPGTGLYFSLILRPPLEPHRTPQLTLVSAVVLARLVEDLCDAAPRIKWPNDLLMNGRKFCGILTELSGDTDRVHWVILGIGLNVNTEKFPTELSPVATSLRLALAAHGREPPARAALLAALLPALDAAVAQYVQSGLGPFRDEWERYAAVRGVEVEVSAPGGRKRRGTARGLAEDGALLLETSPGTIERVLAGDVVMA